MTHGKPAADRRTPPSGRGLRLLALAGAAFVLLLVADLAVLHNKVTSNAPWGVLRGKPELPARRYHGFKVASRLAFGSCTARVAVPQPVWQHGVQKVDPDVWIWAGDFAYMDWPDANCATDHSNPACNCTKDWLHSSRFSCLAGNLLHAQGKLLEQLRHPDYQGFLQFMCPDWSKLSTGSEAPDGADPEVCRRLVLGTWDDHDYNWQDGNRRLNNKDEQKQLFLDALGAPPDHPRRKPGRGLYWKHTLNKGLPGQEVDILLLDGRYHRDPKPCSTRRDFCLHMALKSPAKDKYAWCKDFLHGGDDGRGSCCKKDENLYAGWCEEPDSHADPLWSSACDPTSLEYGLHDLELKSKEGRRRLHKKAMTDVEEESPFCDILGPTQRRWLRHELMTSQAPLKLVVVGSPVFNNPARMPCKGRQPKEGLPILCPCFDDFDCYRPAQINLLHMLARAPGCPVVITGDFHFSDIKVLRGGQQLYSSEYQSEALQRPLYQVMASGLTTETARGGSCDGYHVDKMGLRHPSECSFVAGPAFGMVEVDWSLSEPVVKLQIRDALTSHVKVETKFKLRSCQQL